MTGNTVNIQDAKPQPEADGKRERSTIAFPYGDVGDAISVAQAIHENAGMSCSIDQLAAYLKQTPTSGAFRLNLSTARIFGLIENEKGQVSLTPLGQRIVDPNQQARAKAEALMHVPLYSAIYEKYKGHLLPPAKALEREMAALGVAAKQADKARQAFERSAQEAGYFAHGKERLVPPAFPGGPETLKVDPPPPPNNERRGGGGNGGDELHPFIQGLLKTLPKPEQAWPVEHRVRWLQTAAGIFDLIYKGNDNSSRVNVTSENPSTGKQQPS